MPIGKTEKEMEKWGWVKSLMYERIKYDDTTKNQVILTEYDYYAEKQICGTCKSNEFIWLQIPLYDYDGGVLCSCSRCRRTWGPLSTETIHVSNKKERNVSLEEAIEVIVRTKQAMPPALRKAWQNREVEDKREVREGRRRPPKVGENP